MKQENASDAASNALGERVEAFERWAERSPNRPRDEFVIRRSEARFLLDRLAKAEALARHQAREIDALATNQSITDTPQSRSGSSDA